MMGAAILSIIAIASAYILWTIADKRGANTLFWAVMGALFGPLAIAFIFLAKCLRTIYNNSDPLNI